MVECTPLAILAWIKKLGPSFKYALIPLDLSCIFSYYLIKVDELLLCVTAEFLIPTHNVFQFNGVELCSTLEEFSAIMGEPNVNSLILPTTDEDFSVIAQRLLGISLGMAQRW